MTSRCGQTQRAPDALLHIHCHSFLLERSFFQKDEKLGRKSLNAASVREGRRRRNGRKERSVTAA